MEIETSYLKNGHEVDSFFGKIGVNRGRYTLRFNENTNLYEIVKVLFATEHSKETDIETIYETANIKALERNWKQITKEKDIIIEG